jgi:hypothetical protein
MAGGGVAHKHAPFFARHMSGSELTGTKTLEQFKDSFVRTPIAPLRDDYSCVCGLCTFQNNVFSTE